MMNNPIDPEGRWLYRAGGVSALVVGIAYLVIIGLYVPIGAPPSGAEARLAYVAGNTRTWWAILGLSVVTDFLFVPVALALYHALKEVNSSAMRLATASVGLFIVLDLAITWTNYKLLITLSGKYAAAANDAQEQSTVFVKSVSTAGARPSAVDGSNLVAAQSLVEPTAKRGRPKRAGVEELRTNPIWPSFSCRVPTPVRLARRSTSCGRTKISARGVCSNTLRSVERNYHGLLRSRAHPARPCRALRLRRSNVAKPLNVTRLRLSSALGWFDIRHVHEILGYFQRARDLHVLPLESFGFFLIVEVNTFASLLVRE